MSNHVGMAVSVSECAYPQETSRRPASSSIRYKEGPPRRSTNLSNKENNNGNRRQRASSTARKAKAGTNNKKPIAHRDSDAQATAKCVARSPKRRAGRSASRGRTSGKNLLQQCEELLKRRSGSLPSRRTKSNEKKSCRARRENDGTSVAKKKAPIRRTRSYESITTALKYRKSTRGEAVANEEGNKSLSDYELPLDDRGLPLTSVGCPPVASLRTPSPNNVDTNNFDALYAQKLQQEEFARARHRPTLEQRAASGTNLSSRSLERSNIFEAGDSKPQAKRRSKSSKRVSRKEEKLVSNLVPLNPEESMRCQQKKHVSEAKAFVHRLKSLLDSGADVASPRRLSSSQGENVFTMVLTNEELRDLVASMFRTQYTFRNQGKPARVDVGYHFCRGDNIKRIRQQPGFFSRIQAKGVSRSQDGDGIYTFNNPQIISSTSSADSAVGDVWMAVARLQGTKRSNMTAARRPWSGDADAMVQSEDDVVVLRSPTQFFPLAQFRSTFCTGSHTKGVVTKMRHGLQVLVDDFFNEQGSSPLIKRCRDASDSRDDKNSSPVAPPLSFGERMKAVSNPAAWQVVSEVQAVVEDHMSAAVAMMNNNNAMFAVQSAFSPEETAILANNMFCTQRRFQDSYKPAYIDIGYHYCRGQNLRKMQQKPGFCNIQSRGFNKSEDGDGIYTFNDPLGTRSRGNRPGGILDMRRSVSKDDDVWLLVARLQGQRQISSSTSTDAASLGRKWDQNFDAMIVGGRHSDDVVVLRTSAQFFPVLHFPAASVVADQATLQQLQMIHQRLQSIFDHFFNTGVLKGESGQLVSTVHGEEEVLEYCAPETLDSMKSVHSSTQQIYKVLSNNKKATNDDCSICLDSLRWASNQQVVRLKNCGHEFHYKCLAHVLEHFHLCPICNQEVLPPSPQTCLQGLSPSGIMTVTRASHMFCEGCWAPRGSLVLSFFIPSGLEKIYHARPGRGYLSKSWKAFLPNNKQGVMLLKRLQYAFLRGLLFSVCAANQSTEGNVCLASIPLKMCPSSAYVAGSNEGFPDPTYPERCNSELDRCGVPEFASCLEFILQNQGVTRNSGLPYSSLKNDEDRKETKRRPKSTCERKERTFGKKITGEGKEGPMSLAERVELELSKKAKTHKKQVKKKKKTKKSVLE